MHNGFLLWKCIKDQIYNSCILVYFHHGVWIHGVFHSWNDNLSSVVVYAYDLLRRQSKTVKTSSKANKAGWSTFWLFFPSRTMNHTIIKQKYQKAKQNNTKQNIQKHMKPVLCWSITHGLWSCSGVWFMYLWHTIGAKCFFLSHRYHLYGF